MGNVMVLKKVIKHFFTHPRSMKPIQWWEYFITSSYYLVGWAFMFLLLCPIIYILFDLPSFFMNPIIYSLSFMPYLILSLCVFYMSMSGRNYKKKDIFKGQLLFFVSLPTYLRATLMGILGSKKGFAVTSKEGSRQISYLSLWPQLLLWTINLAAITWSINRFVYSYSPAVIVNMIWITYHFVLLSSMFYFNEDVELEKI